MKVSVNFYNMWGGFFPHDNLITNTLKLKYDVAVNVNNPDIVICQNTESVRAHDITKEFVNKTKVIHWYVEASDRIGNPNYDECNFSITSCKFNHPNNIRIPLWSMYVDWFNNPYCKGRNQAYLISPSMLIADKQKKDKDKFCCILTNNDLGYRKIAYPKFINFAISKGLLVESRGNFCQTMPKLNGDEKDKIEFIRDFKFHLTFDNSDRSGWITEKLIHAFSESTIPIYWGGIDVEEEFNPHAFIHVRRFNTLDEVHQKVFDLYNDKNLFYEMQTQPCFNENKIPDYSKPEYILPFFERIIE